MQSGIGPARLKLWLVALVCSMLAPLAAASAATITNVELGDKVIALRFDAPVDRIEMLAVSHDAAWRIETPLIEFEVMPNGTGDTVAALFTAHWLATDDVPTALSRAASSVYAVLEKTREMGERELQLVAAQDCLVTPPFRFAAEKL
mgnify:CR=1 FL=1